MAEIYVAPGGRIEFRLTEDEARMMGSLHDKKKFGQWEPFVDCMDRLCWQAVEHDRLTIHAMPGTGMYRWRIEIRGKRDLLALRAVVQAGTKQVYLVPGDADLLDPDLAVVHSSWET